MRLRTFEPFWLLKNGIVKSYPSLGKGLRTEMLVVGGGITGALISHALMEEGYNVVLIDKRDIGHGSTAATTSMLQYEIDEPLYKLSKKIGEDAAALCYRAGIQAIKQLRDLLKHHKIDCGFKMKKSLYIAHNKTAAVDLKKEYEIRNKYKLGVKWLTASEIKKKYGIICHGGILSSTAASADPFLLTHGLIDLNVQRGMQVFDQTGIKTINCKGSKPFVITESGHKVTANKIIFCTGYESTGLLKEKVAKLFYTYACVSEQGIAINKNLKNTLVWDTGDPYLYMRSTSDGRLLAGGEDAFFRKLSVQQKVKENKSHKIQQKLKKILPSLRFEEDFSWGGVFGSTKDSLPYIGESPEYKNAYFVLGFGGNGITFSIQGMKIITDLLKGEENKLAQYYRFGR